MAHTIVVVPCYNEAERLDLGRFLRYVLRETAVDFLLVNDGSGDRTLELLERLHRADPRRFSFLHLARNVGKAEAVRRGMQLALAAQPDYVGFWDADLATPLEEIDSMIRLLERRPEIELAVGTRIRLLGRSIERRAVREMLGQAFSRLASAVLGIRLYDTQCGAKLFRVTAPFQYALHAPFRSRWIFDVELLARLSLARRRASACPLSQTIYEHPVEAWREVAGSKLRGWDFPKALVELAGICWDYRRLRVWPSVSASEPSGGDASASRGPTDKPRQRAA